MEHDLGKFGTAKDFEGIQWCYVDAACMPLSPDVEAGEGLSGDPSIHFKMCTPENDGDQLTYSWTAAEIITWAHQNGLDDHIALTHMHSDDKPVNNLALHEHIIGAPNKCP